jgi:hypothetical protein
MQVRSLTFIKLVLFLTIGPRVFNFTELEKIILVPFKLLLMYPHTLLDLSNIKGFDYTKSLSIFN